MCKTTGAPKGEVPRWVWAGAHCHNSNDTGDKQAPAGV